MIQVRCEYSFSQAVLDERRSGCASYIMYGYRALAWPRRYGPTAVGTCALGAVTCRQTRYSQLT
jgi:hypothetical protein